MDGVNLARNRNVYFTHTRLIPQWLGQRDNVRAGLGLQAREAVSHALRTMTGTEKTILMVKPKS